MKYNMTKMKTCHKTEYLYIVALNNNV